MPQPRDLVAAAVGLLALPFILSFLGLGVTSASEVAIFAIACMALVSGGNVPGRGPRLRAELF